MFRGCAEYARATHACGVLQDVLDLSFIISKNHTCARTVSPARASQSSSHALERSRCDVFLAMLRDVTIAAQRKT